MRGLLRQQLTSSLIAADCAKELLSCHGASEDVQSLAYVDVAGRARGVERDELGEVVTVEVVRLDDDRARTKIVEVAAQVLRLCAASLDV